MDLRRNGHPFRRAIHSSQVNRGEYFVSFRPFYFDFADARLIGAKLYHWKRYFLVYLYNSRMEFDDPSKHRVDPQPYPRGSTLFPQSPLIEYQTFSRGHAFDSIHQIGKDQI